MRAIQNSSVFYFNLHDHQLARTYMTQTTQDHESLINKLSIPSRPEALIVVNVESKHEYPDIEKIAEAIGSDVSLSAAVFQIINSPAFRVSQPITNIQQAVNLLGVSRVERVVTVVSLRSELSSDLNLGRFWDSATEIANVSSQLSAKLTGVSSDDAYTLGLFHGAGIPLMMQAFDDYKSTLIEMNSTERYPVTVLEEERFGVTHNKLTYLLLKKWHLPEHIGKAAYFHHYRFSDMLKSGQIGDDALSLLAILKMAEDVSETYRQAWRQNEQASEWEHAKEDVTSFLGIDLEDYREIKDDLLEWLNLEYQ